MPKVELLSKCVTPIDIACCSGIEQGDTASTVEVNLALALQAYDGVEDVQFTTVWNQGHTMAERTGNSTDNFIAWVNDVVKQ